MSIQTMYYEYTKVFLYAKIILNVNYKKKLKVLNSTFDSTTDLKII